MDELWDIARVAQYLGVSERTVYTKVRSGALPAIKVGRLWRIREGDLKAWLDEPAGYVAPAPEGGGIAAETGAIPERAELEAAVNASADTLVRRLSFVAFLSAGVTALGWPAPVVVGGHAVEFYTAGEYPTQDIDLASASEPVAQVLGAWGFEREGRHWYDATLGIVVEVPGASLGPDERNHVFSIEVKGRTALVLGIEDLIVDRLAACVHWNDEESCRWARTLLRGAPELDVEYLDRRVREESVVDAFVRIARREPS